MAPVAILLALAGAAEVWAEPAHIAAAPEAGPSDAAWTRTVRLIAARNEAESVQVIVRAGARDLEGVRLAAEPVAEATQAPQAYRIRSLATSLGASWPDILCPAAPADVPAGESARFWVTFPVRADAEPGFHYGAISVDLGRGRPRKLAVALEVSSLRLPERPMLRTWVQLGRARIAGAYGWSVEDVEAWRPLYALLGRARLSAALWGEGLVSLGPGDIGMTHLLKRHVRAAREEGAQYVVPLGHEEQGLDWFSEDASGRLDPAAVYLRDMGAWLREQGWLADAVVRPAVPDSLDWDAVRAGFLRAFWGDRRFRRLHIGPMPPGLRSQVDIWSQPAGLWDPSRPLGAGGGEALAFRAPEGVAVRVSGTDPNPPELGYAPDPAHCIDGDLTTSWISEAGGEPLWLALRFEEPREVERFTVYWHAGLGGTAALQVSADGTAYASVPVTWNHDAPLDPRLSAVSRARIREGGPVAALKLLLRPREGARRVGLREIALGEACLEPVAGGEARRTQALWQHFAPDAFPSAYAPNAQARLLPWVCWAREAEGMTLPALAQWPAEWTPSADDLTVPREALRNSAWLCYPGAEGVLSSVRLERLRDGLEDYDLLYALDAAQAGGLAVEGLANIRSALRLPMRPGTHDLERLLERGIELRTRALRALDAFRPNRGP